MASQSEFRFVADPAGELLAPGAMLLRAAAAEVAPELLQVVDAVAALAPFRHMETRTGKPLAAAMTNCGSFGWYGDRRGYRYSEVDPVSGQPWPAIAPQLAALATRWAAMAGFAGFVADSCLINRYGIGTGMSLHQDRDETDFRWPIVSVSLGLPIVFLLGGLTRRDTTLAVELRHGDVLVFGGKARLRFHGVRKLRAGSHALTGPCRINLTLRRAR